MCCAKHYKKKSIDILNAVDCVSTTKVLLGELRNNGWEPLLEEVKLFCEKQEIDIPDLSTKYVIFPNYFSMKNILICPLIICLPIFKYVDVTKSRNKNDNTTAFHHYKVDVFNVAIDQQVIELEDRFSSQVTELLSLCGPLDPRTDEFDIENTCSLVEKILSS